MKNSGSIEERLAVREFYGSFAHASSLGMTAEWMGHWAADCTWKTQHFTLQGEAKVREQWDQLWANFDKVALLHEICSVEVDGDRATVVCIAREIIQLSVGGIYKLAGCYQDTLVRVGGDWRFASREYQPLVEEPPAAPAGPSA
ncbi:nuclear transport factor 2 family protein [Haliea sp. E17]|uniref:nuclear transport factor 2 family protein n=1 Tax=Haliea sp. E17 TaxID=3401576 RepID=UPI003AAD1417